MTTTITLTIASALLLLIATYQFGRKRLFQERPLIFIFSLLSAGSIITNILFSLTYSVLPPNAEDAFLVYCWPTLIFCLAISIYPRFTPRHPTQKTAQPISNNFYLIASIPFFAVTLYFLYCALNSGASYSSPEWRSSIAGASTGYTYLIYNSGATILAAFIASQKKLNTKNIIFILGMAISLSIYGGRFLAAVALLVGIGVYTSKKTELKITRLIYYTATLVFMFLAVAFIRYSISEQLSRDTALFIATMQRQLAGNAYDFSLSYPYVNQEIAAKLIIEKIKTATLPVLLNYDEPITIGSYLATSAGREFEFGHRISAIGESFYAFGPAGPTIMMMLFIILIHMADSLAKRTSDKYIIGIAIGTSAIYSFFIDISFAITFFYMTAYLIAINHATKLIKNKKIKFRPKNKASAPTPVSP